MSSERVLIVSIGISTKRTMNRTENMLDISVVRYKRPSCGFCVTEVIPKSMPDEAKNAAKKIYPIKELK